MEDVKTGVRTDVTIEVRDLVNRYKPKDILYGIVVIGSDGFKIIKGIVSKVSIASEVIYTIEVLTGFVPSTLSADSYNIPQHRVHSAKTSILNMVSSEFNKIIK